MSTVIERRPTEIPEEQLPTNGLFQVWIDLAAGEASSDWWWNSPPQPLRDALEEAAETRQAGWVCKVMPEGQNPRPDGRWDNP
jgi:hypothetical protein